MILAILSYKKPLEKVDEYLEEHRLYLEKNFEQGHFLLAGRRNPPVGGVILMNQPTKEEAAKIIQEDPFYTNDLAEYRLIEFTPSKFSEEFENIFTQTS